MDISVEYALAFIVYQYCRHDAMKSWENVSVLCSI